MAVIGEDGDFRASPFSVQFGKMKRDVVSGCQLSPREEGHLAAEVRSRGQPRGQQPRRAGQHGPGQRGPRILSSEGGPGAKKQYRFWSYCLDENHNSDLSDIREYTNCAESKCRQ